MFDIFLQCLVRKESSFSIEILPSFSRQVANDALTNRTANSAHVTNRTVISGACYRLKEKYVNSVVVG